MKKLLALTLLMTALLASAQQGGDNKPLPKSEDITFDKDMASYAVGYRMGIQMAGRKDSVFALDVDKAVEGMKAAAAEKDPSFDREKMAEEYGNYQRKLQIFQAEQYKKIADESKKRSDEFLAQNRKKTGIKELASGIQYRVIEDGSGKNASLDNTVIVHYSGKLIGDKDFDNYQEFDSTYTRGQPMEMDMSKVGMKGWREIIPMMKKGDKWQVFLPPEMAYGEQGQGPIGPNEVLVFDVHLVDIK